MASKSLGKQLESLMHTALEMCGTKRKKKQQLPPDSVPHESLWLLWITTTVGSKLKFQGEGAVFSSVFNAIDDMVGILVLATPLTRVLLLPPLAPVQRPVANEATPYDMLRPHGNEHLPYPHPTTFACGRAHSFLM